MCRGTSRAEGWRRSSATVGGLERTCTTQRLVFSRCLANACHWVTAWSRPLANTVGQCAATDPRVRERFDGGAALRGIFYTAEASIALSRTLPGKAKSVADLGPTMPSVEQDTDLLFDRPLGGDLFLHQHAQVAAVPRRPIARWRSDSLDEGRHPRGTWGRCRPQRSDGCESRCVHARHDGMRCAKPRNRFVSACFSMRRFCSTLSAHGGLPHPGAKGLCASPPGEPRGSG
jgi:hypothetical protein